MARSPEVVERAHALTGEMDYIRKWHRPEVAAGVRLNLCGFCFALNPCGATAAIGDRPETPKNRTSPLGLRVNPAARRWRSKMPAVFAIPG